MSIVELMRGYKVCAETCMGVKPGENVLIITDLDNMDRAEGLAIASFMADAEPIILCEPSLKKFTSEPSKLVRECMMNADVVFVSLPLFYSTLLFHTQARKDTVKTGVRLGVVCLNSENADVTKEEIMQTKKLSEQLATLLTQAETVRVRTKKGTDITMSIKGRKALAFSGLMNRPGDSGMIPHYGEAAIAPVEGSAEGTVVVDGSMSGLGLFREPVVWRVQKGKVVEITGKEDAQRLKDLLKKADENAINIAELGIGTVARGEITGNDDDKKLLGTGHIAIGNNLFGGGSINSNIHLDGIFRNMTLELDGSVIMEDGVLKF
ncbi:MAG: aminopeptidase [Chloroflexota bacterium]